MRALLVALACTVAMSTNATAVTADVAVTAPIHQFIDNFNKGDEKAAEATHVAEPIIVDEVAPYHWQGHGSFKAWLGDLDKHDKAHGVTDGLVKLGDPIRQEIDGDHAYVVMACDYLFKQKGVSMKAPAQMTFALQKDKDGWRISGWTYAAPRGTPVKP
jgi:ketosteroid isomerase-like protein